MIARQQVIRVGLRSTWIRKYKVDFNTGLLRGCSFCRKEVYRTGK